MSALNFKVWIPTTFGNEFSDRRMGRQLIVLADRASQRELSLGQLKARVGGFDPLSRPGTERSHKPFGRFLQCCNGGIQPELIFAIGITDVAHFPNTSLTTHYQVCG
jgi:hypothetical protein